MRLSPEPTVRVTPEPLLWYDVRGRTWRQGPTDVTCEDGVRGRTFVVPALTQTDLSSIPRVLWLVVAPFELSTAAPVVHDWLYRHGGAPPDLATTPYTRAAADALFGDVLAVEGVSRGRQRLAVLAVRLFGWWNWRARGAVKRVAEGADRG